MNAIFRPRYPASTANKPVTKPRAHSDTPFVMDNAQGNTTDRGRAVLRSLAVLFLVIAVANSVLAVHDAVTWPLAVAAGCTALALGLERRAARRDSSPV